MDVNFQLSLIQIYKYKNIILWHTRIYKVKHNISYIIITSATKKISLSLPMEASRFPRAIKSHKSFDHNQFNHFGGLNKKKYIVIDIYV